VYKYAKIFVCYARKKTKKGEGFILIKIVLKKYNKNQYKFKKVLAFAY
jgi:hypothetical protein